MSVLDMLQSSYPIFANLNMSKERLEALDKYLNESSRLTRAEGGLTIVDNPHPAFQYTKGAAAYRLTSEYYGVNMEPVAKRYEALLLMIAYFFFDGDVSVADNLTTKDFASARDIIDSFLFSRCGLDAEDERLLSDVPVAYLAADKVFAVDYTIPREATTTEHTEGVGVGLILSEHGPLATLQKDPVDSQVVKFSDTVFVSYSTSHTVTIEGESGYDGLLGALSAEQVLPAVHGLAEKIRATNRAVETVHAAAPFIRKLPTRHALNLKLKEFAAKHGIRYSYQSGETLLAIEEKLSKVFPPYRGHSVFVSADVQPAVGDVHGLCALLDHVAEASRGGSASHILATRMFFDYGVTHDTIREFHTPEVSAVAITEEEAAEALAELYSKVLSEKDPLSWDVEDIEVRVSRIGAQLRRIPDAHLREVAIGVLRQAYEEQGIDRNIVRMRIHASWHQPYHHLLFLASKETGRTVKDLIKQAMLSGYPEYCVNYMLSDTSSRHALSVDGDVAYVLIISQ